MRRYRVHYAHPNGIDTTGAYDSERDLAVGDIFEVDGERWQVEEVEPFELEDYDGYVAVVRPDESD